MPSLAVLELLVQLKDQASAGLGAIGNAMSTLGGIAGGAALAGVAAFGAGVVSGIGDAREAAQIMAQTEAVIRSTGGAAGYTADQIGDMAGSLSAASGLSLFGDSDIQKGQNLLLTFTNIGETLPETTQTMIDMAQAMGTDVSGGAIQLGKALNDPINGISALSRVGVSFTDQQKEQIRTMQEAGDMAGAQRVILAELNKEFGGSAKAAADADGGMARFNDRMGEAFETLGALVLPIMNQFADLLNDVIMPILENVVGAVSELFDTFADAGGMSSEFAESMGYLASQLGLPGDQVQDLVIWIQDNLIPTVMDLVAWFQDQLPKAIATLTEYWETVLLPILGALVELWENDLGPALMLLQGWLQEQLPVAIARLGEFWQTTLLPIIQEVAAFIATEVIPTVGRLVTWLADVLPGAIAVVSAFIQTQLIPAIQGAWTWFEQNLLPTLIKIAEWLIVHIPPAITTTSNFITQQLIPALSAAGEFIRDNFLGWVDAFLGAIEKIKFELGELAKIPDQIATVFRNLPEVPGRLLGGSELPGFAGGVSNFSGGLALVGERGPELVSLPRGSSVFSNDQSAGMLGGGVTVMVDARGSMLTEQQIKAAARQGAQEAFQQQALRSRIK